MESALLDTTIIQAGFAGLCIVQLAVMVWLVGRVFVLMEHTTDAMSKNATIQSQVAQDLRELSRIARTHTDEIRGLSNKMVSRPCIAKRECVQ